MNMSVTAIVQEIKALIHQSVGLGVGVPLEKRYEHAVNECIARLNEMFDTPHLPYCTIYSVEAHLQSCSCSHNLTTIHHTFSEEDYDTTLKRLLLVYLNVTFLPIAKKYLPTSTAIAIDICLMSIVVHQNDKPDEWYEHPIPDTSIYEVENEVRIFTAAHRHGMFFTLLLNELLDFEQRVEETILQPPSSKHVARFIEWFQNLILHFENFTRNSTFVNRAFGLSVIPIINNSKKKNHGMPSYTYWVTNNNIKEIRTVYIYSTGPKCNEKTTEMMEIFSTLKQFEPVNSTTEIRKTTSEGEEIVLQYYVLKINSARAVEYAWKNLQEQYESQQQVGGVIQSVKKSTVRVKIFGQYFDIPAQFLSAIVITDLRKIFRVGKTLALDIILFDFESRKVVFSNINTVTDPKNIIEEAVNAETPVYGVIRKINTDTSGREIGLVVLEHSFDYGIYIPKEKLTINATGSLSKDYTIGEIIEVWIDGFNPYYSTYTGKLSGSDTLWEDTIEEYYPLGSVLSVRIKHITDEIVIADNDAGIECKFIKNEMSWKPEECDLSQFNTNQKIDVKVIAIDWEAHRVIVSPRQVDHIVQHDFIPNYEYNCIIIKHKLSSNGQFIGLITRSELLEADIYIPRDTIFDNRFIDYQALCPLGEIVKVVVDTYQEAYSTFTGHLSNWTKPWDSEVKKSIHVGMNVILEVKAVIDTLILGEIVAGIECRFHKNEITWNKAKCTVESLSIGQKLAAKVTLIDEVRKQFVVSPKLGELTLEEKIGERKIFDCTLLGWQGDKEYEDKVLVLSHPTLFRLVHLDREKILKHNRTSMSSRYSIGDSIPLYIQRYDETAGVFIGSMVNEFESWLVDVRTNYPLRSIIPITITEIHPTYVLAVTAHNDVCKFFALEISWIKSECDTSRYQLKETVNVFVLEYAKANRQIMVSPRKIHERPFLPKSWTASYELDDPQSSEGTVESSDQQANEKSTTPDDELLALEENIQQPHNATVEDTPVKENVDSQSTEDKTIVSEQKTTTPKATKKAEHQPSKSQPLVLKLKQIEVEIERIHRKAEKENTLRLKLYALHERLSGDTDADQILHTTNDMPTDAVAGSPAITPSKERTYYEERLHSRVRVKVHAVENGAGILVDYKKGYEYGFIDAKEVSGVNIKKMKRFFTSGLKLDVFVIGFQRSTNTVLFSMKKLHIKIVEE